MVAWPSMSTVPVTVKLSSIVVSPVAESRTRLPDAVSISLEPETPIWTLSAVMSVDVIAALKVDVALTVKLSTLLSPIVVLPSTWRLPSTSALSVMWTFPPAESRIRSPVVVLISLLASTPIWIASAVMSVLVIAWLNVTVPVTVWLSPAWLPIVALPSTVRPVSYTHLTLPTNREV